MMQAQCLLKAHKHCPESESCECVCHNTIAICPQCGETATYYSAKTTCLKGHSILSVFGDEITADCSPVWDDIIDESDWMLVCSCEHEWSVDPNEFDIEWV